MVPLTEANVNALYSAIIDRSRNDIRDESVDLVYLDPPFNSQASYNVLFRSTSGERSEAQIEAFDDTWHWGAEAERAFDETVHSGNSDAAELLRALRVFLKENDMMAYLCMMSVRLLELHRVLRLTGSIYLHCDQTAGHYLKILMDAIFGPLNFRSEIVWQRTNVHNDSHDWSDVADILLYYVKDCRKLYTWNPQYVPHSERHVASKYKEDENGRLFTLSDMTSPHPRPNMMYDWRGYPSPPWDGATARRPWLNCTPTGRIWYPSEKSKRPRLKRYLDEMPGNVLTNVWTDINPINSQAQERLGYPTQKPQALLERILRASSNEGNMVLDPFCGCGTTIHAAQKLKREWIGIDITHLAVSLIEKRLNSAFPGIQYQVHGTPKDLEGARDLAMRDKHEFQLWASAKVNAVPFRGGKKGADSGIDGLIYFKPEGKTTEKAIVSVKGGDNVNVAMVRDLAHVVDREKAKIGVFITLADSTGPMRTEAVKAGYYETLYGKYPKIQILTIEELFSGKQPNIPLVDSASFKKAPRELEGGEQDALPF